MRNTIEIRNVISKAIKRLQSLREHFDTTREIGRIQIEKLVARLIELNDKSDLQAIINSNNSLFVKIKEIVEGNKSISDASHLSIARERKKIENLLKNAEEHAKLVSEIDEVLKSPYTFNPHGSAYGMIFRKMGENTLISDNDNEHEININNKETTKNKPKNKTSPSGGGGK